MGATYSVAPKGGSDFFKWITSLQEQLQTFSKNSHNFFFKKKKYLMKFSLYGFIQLSTII